MPRFKEISLTATHIDSSSKPISTELGLKTPPASPMTAVAKSTAGALPHFNFPRLVRKKSGSRSKRLLQLALAPHCTDVPLEFGRTILCLLTLGISLLGWEYIYIYIVYVGVGGAGIYEYL